MDTNHLSPALPVADEDLSSAGARANLLPYEPPKMFLVGRVHDLVAGGSGTTDEMEEPFARKQAGQPG